MIPSDELTDVAVVLLEYLQRCSAQAGYSAPLLEKVVRLGEIAGDVARHPFLGRVLP